MKILQIYSNSPKFKTVKFNEQFNVVLGDIKYAEDLNKDSHNLGKSTLIHLIDFMLLKSIDKNHFLKNPLFQNHVFFMEIKLNSGIYLTIKRAIINNTKISFKVHDEPYQNYINEIDWDYTDLALKAKDANENPVTVLNRLLGFDVLSDYSYRKSANYFFRTQNDYMDVFRLKKFGGKDVDWKPTLFELLGFSSQYMIDKYKLDAEKSQKSDLIEQIKKEFKVSEADIDKIKGLIEIKEAEKNQIIAWLDKFDFYEQDNKVEKDIILKIEEKISELNNERYNIDYEVNEIDKSLKQNIYYDLDKIKELYSEVSIVLPDLLIKEYKELLSFNEKVFNERKRYLLNTLESKNARLAEIEKDLRKLNQSRKDNMSAFTQSETFEKYNAYRASLIDVEKELTKYATELDNVDVIKNLNKEIGKIDSQISDSIFKLKEQIEEGNSEYSAIRKDFHDFVKMIINQEGMISLSVNGSGNIEFKDEIVDAENAVTAQNDGHTYKKVLCACFDLALIKNYINKCFYKTVYHDGCLESLDPRKQKQYWNLMRNISKEYNIQYILTALKSDIPTDENGTLLLRDYEIAVTLSDESNDAGRLFGFSF